jgi:hypothetical protein
MCLNNFYSFYYYHFNKREGDDFTAFLRVFWSPFLQTGLASKTFRLVFVKAMLTLGACGRVVLQILCNVFDLYSYSEWRSSVREPSRILLVFDKYLFSKRLEKGFYSSNFQLSTGKHVRKIHLSSFSWICAYLVRYFATIWQNLTHFKSETIVVLL